MTQYIRNAWYVAAWSREVGRQLLARRILDEPVLLYRKNDGTPVALLDRCAHKLAPLSMGRLEGDVVQCGYHGMEYDCTGQCVRVPGQERIPKSAKVRSFPLVERYNAVWIWTGEAALADPAKIIEIEHYDEPGWKVLDGGYQFHEAGYINIADNLMDPAHTTFVHGRTIGMASASEVPVQVEEGENFVCAHRWTNDIEPIATDRRILQFNGRVDRRQSYNYFPPCVSRVDAVTVPTGQGHGEDVIARGVRTAGYKFLTPETGERTHFSMAALSTFTTSRGMPAGPESVNHVYDSNPGNPDSAIVGRSGTTLVRALLDTPSARMRPDLICGSSDGIEPNIASTLPPISSGTVNALPS